MRSDIPDDHRPGADCGPFSHLEAGNDAGAEADEGARSETNIAGKVGTRCDVRVIADDTVMINAGMGVEDDVIAECARWLEYGTGEEDGAIAYARVPDDIGARMHECCPGDGPGNSFCDCGADAIGADRDDGVLDFESLD